LRLLAIATVSTPSAFADIVCIGCYAIGGSGGRGGDTGDAISGDIGPGGSCFARDHSTIGDEMNVVVVQVVASLVVVPVTIVRMEAEEEKLHSI
jgi:hypothetical protein